MEEVRSERPYFRLRSEVRGEEGGGTGGKEKGTT